jgi:hypothetical protein
VTESAKAFAKNLLAANPVSTDTNYRVPMMHDRGEFT